MARGATLVPLIALLFWGGGGGASVAQPSSAPAPAPAPRSPDQPVRYRLVPTPEGGYVHDGPRLRARIARDGTVTFSRDPQFVIPDGPQHQRTPGRDPISAGGGDSPGREPVYVESRPGVRLDLTEWYLRTMRQDPDRHEKATFLTATFELRTRLVAEDRNRSVQESLAELPARLQALWSDRALSPQEKKNVLSLWWSELADTPEGLEAAEVIAGFARRHLTPAEAEAFRRAAPRRP